MIILSPSIWSHFHSSLDVIAPAAAQLEQAAGEVDAGLVSDSVKLDVLCQVVEAAAEKGNREVLML